MTHLVLETDDSADWGRRALVCPCPNLLAGQYHAASENSLGNTCSGCDNWPSRTLLALAKCADHGLQIPPACLHDERIALGMPRWPGHQRCDTSACFWRPHRGMHSDSWDGNMRLFLESIRLCNVSPERSGVDEGSRRLELVPFAPTNCRDHFHCGT